MINDESSEPAVLYSVNLLSEVQALRKCDVKQCILIAEN